MSERFSTIVVGHDEAAAAFREALASGRMHHAWLITGIEGIGKATLAHHVAREVLSGTGSSHSANAERLVANEAHPDLLLVRRESDEKTGEPRRHLLVDDVARVTLFLRRTASTGGWRVVIIEDAHTLNRNAQNALLKILEEPPAAVLILLTATSVGSLLPTIRSRCRLLPLSALGDGDLRTLLRDRAPDAGPETLERLIEVADGSLGFALRLARTASLALFDELLALIRSDDRLDIARLHKLADQVAKKADADLFGGLVRLLLRDLQSQAVEAAMERSALVHLRIEHYDRTRDLFRSAEVANLDRKMALINVVTELRDKRGAAA